MRGQSIGVNNQAQFLLGKDHVTRLDPKVAASEFSLDGAQKAENLIGKAAHISRRFVPDFQARFLDHLAPNYTPLHK
jgi:hypothetical protein